MIFLQRFLGPKIHMHSDSIWKDRYLWIQNSIKMPLDLRSFSPAPERDDFDCILSLIKVFCLRRFCSPLFGFFGSWIFQRAYRVCYTILQRSDSPLTNAGRTMSSFEKNKMVVTTIASPGVVSQAG
jgi:hypothetical protein